MEKDRSVQEEILEVTEKLYAGRIQNFYDQWLRLTNDKTILKWVNGYSIPFIKKPKQDCKLSRRKFNNTEFQNYANCIKRLQSIGAINKCKPCKNQFISSYFLVPKPNGDYRFVLNLKKLNTFVSLSHFKMENFKSVKDIITKNSYMSSVDLKDAYFLVSINKKQKISKI